MSVSSYHPPLPEDRLRVTCFHCGRSQEVGRKAMTLTCKHCSKTLRVEDIKIKQYEARRVIETCGTVSIEKKGNVIADRITCGGMHVRGKLKGEVTCRGGVVLEAEAEVKGNIHAASMAVQLGAQIEGRLDIRPKEEVEDSTGSPEAGARA